MDKIIVTLENNFDFQANTVTENYNAADKSYNLIIIIPLQGDKSLSEIVQNITPENLAAVKVEKNGKQIDVISGYTEIMSVDKNIDLYSQIITVRAVKPK